MASPVCDSCELTTLLGQIRRTLQQLALDLLAARERHDWEECLRIEGRLVQAARVCG
jgi:hypothetical protein